MEDICSSQRAGELKVYCHPGQRSSQTTGHGAKQRAGGGSSCTRAHANRKGRRDWGATGAAGEGQAGECAAQHGQGKAEALGKLGALV